MTKKRRGRPRKPGKRAPSGRPSRAGQQGDVFAVARNQPHRRGLADFRDERAVDVLGRLAIAGLITTEQYAAGKEWRALVAAHRRAIGAPSPDPRAAGADYVAEQVGGEPEAGVSQERPVVDNRSPEERDRATIRRYQEAFGALHDAGRFALLEVNTVATRDELCMRPASLCAGLTALAWHFGLVGKRAPDRADVAAE